MALFDILNYKGNGNDQLIPEFCTNGNPLERFSILHEAMKNAFSKMILSKVNVNDSVNLFYDLLELNIEERIDRFNPEIQVKFQNNLYSQDLEVRVFSILGLTLVNVVLEKFVLEEFQETFLSIIRDHCSNIDKYKRVDNFFLNIRKQMFTIEEMKKTVEGLKKDVREFIWAFNKDLVHREQNLKNVNFKEILRFVKDRLDILEQNRHFLEGTQWLPEFRQRINALIPARKALGNLERPVRVSKERIKELKEFREKILPPLPKYEEPEEIKDWDW